MPPLKLFLDFGPDGKPFGIIELGRKAAALPFVVQSGEGEWQ